MKENNLEKGRSMIEMLGVLAIIGVLSVGGIAGYSKAMHRYRVNKTIEQITLIAGNIRAFFAPQKNYNGLLINPAVDNEVARKAKLLPEEMMELRSDGTLFAAHHAFEGYFKAYSTGRAASGDNKAFYFQISGLSVDACIDIVSQDWSNAGVNVIHFTGGSGKYATTPISVDNAVNWCSTYKNEGGSVDLNFYFDVDINSTYWQGILNPSS